MKDAISFINYIENKYQVDKIQVLNLDAWPIFRLHIISKYRLRHLKEESEREIRLSKDIIKLLLKSTLYGFPNWFRAYKVLSFGNSERRKLLDGEMYDRVLEGALEHYGKDVLHIENPVRKGHLQTIPTKRFVSEAFLFLLQSLFIPFLKVEIKHVEIFKEIETEFDLKLSPYGIAKRFVSQRILGKILYALYKPKAIFLVNHPSYYGYTSLFKEKKVPVIEFQHGVVSPAHPSYMVSKKFDGMVYPDYFLTYSLYEKKIISQANWMPVNQMMPFGYYFLSKVKEKNSLVSRIIKTDNAFSIVACVVGQDPFEKRILEFISAVAKQTNDVLYQYVPRTRGKDYNSYNLPANLIIDDRDVYDVINNADVHIAYLSTTILEALYLNKPNLIIDFDGQAQQYYEKFELSKEFTSIIANEKDFISNIYAINYNAKDIDLKEGNRYFEDKADYKLLDAIIGM